MKGVSKAKLVAIHEKPMNSSSFYKHSGKYWCFGGGLFGGFFHCLMNVCVFPFTLLDAFLDSF